MLHGTPARRARFYRNPETAKATTLASKSTTTLNPGDVVSVQTPGGGGYGDPLERDPEAVLEDVRDGKVSVARAEGAYGVVVADGELDAAATERCRAARRDAATDGGDRR